MFIPLRSLNYIHQKFAGHFHVKIISLAVFVKTQEMLICSPLPEIQLEWLSLYQSYSTQIHIAISPCVYLKYMYVNIIHLPCLLIHFLKIFTYWLIHKNLLNFSVASKF